MNNLRTFIDTYWRHAKGYLDAIMFIAGALSFFFSLNYSLSPYVGLTVLGTAFILAFYKTWLYEHNERLSLLGNEVTYERLDDTEKLIVDALKDVDEKRVVIVEYLGGSKVGILGNGGDYKAREKLEAAPQGEVKACLQELVYKGVLTIDTHNSRGNPIYAPTKLGFDMMKKLVG